VTKNAYRKSSTSFGCFVALRRRCQRSMRSYWPCQPGLLCKLHGSSGGGGAPRRAVIGVYPYNVPGERRRRKPTTALTADGDETAGPQRT
jgi:hypothetical protein